MSSREAAPHPSPHRRHIAGWRIAAGLAGAPAAWIAIMSLSLIWPGCSGRLPLGWAGIAAVIIAAACGGLACDAWRRIRAEAAGGEARTLDIGEGRARFLAMLGMLSSGLFGLASLYSALAAFLVSSC
jgi:hypothetical protein